MNLSHKLNCLGNPLEKSGFSRLVKYDQSHSDFVNNVMFFLFGRCCDHINFQEFGQCSWKSPEILYLFDLYDVPGYVFELVLSNDKT